ncbi:hypothetical protein [Phnomibacter sp. MR]|uniref:hypothetical protein n=1 Tax=Phnomibacter sp. MR TaxID=3042318 RepID=UPI003A7FA1FB
MQLIRHTITVLLSVLLLPKAFTQNPVGKWKKLSHTIEYAGEKIDSYKTVLQLYPVAARLAHAFDEAGNFRLECSGTDCKEKYVVMQQKLYAQTKWRLTGNVLMLSSSGFRVGQSYSIRLSGNKMIWEGTEGQGTIVYEKIQ